MARFTQALALSLAACLIGGVASAQSTPTDPGVAPPSASMPQPATASAMAPMAPAPTMPADATLSPGVNENGVRVISSPPVPDTPANRAKYGGPASKTGQQTAAAGN